MKKINKFFLPIMAIIFVMLGYAPTVTGQGTITFNSNGTFTVPPGVTTVTYKIWAAGGGAGVPTIASSASGGGGGGAYVQVTRTNLIPGQTYTVTVGIGGAPGADGGASSVDGSTAQGGRAGSSSIIGGRGGSSTNAPFNVVASGANFSAGSSQQGGDGGGSTNPDPLGGGEGGGGAMFGSDGSPGNNGGTSPNTIGGSGGSLSGGDGGNQGANGANGGAIGGGGGGRGEGASTTGGSGASGRVEITYACPTLNSISYNSPFCNSGSATVTYNPTTATGGTFTSSTLGSSLSASTGVISANAPAGAHTVTYSWPAANGCPAQTATFNIVIGQSPGITTFDYVGTPYCNNNANVVLPSLTAVGATGTYSYTNGANAQAGLNGFSATSGGFTPQGSTPGTYTVTYTIPASNGCPSINATKSITVTALPTIDNFDYPPPGNNNSSYCAGAGLQSPTSTITNPNNNTITYSSSPSGLTIDPATGVVNPATSTPGTYVVTLTIAAGGGCAAVPATTNVTILARPTAVINYDAAAGNSFCQTVFSTNQTVSITGVTGGPLVNPNFTATPSNLTINATTGTINLNSAPGVYQVKYRFNGANGCLDSSTVQVTIRARPTSTLTTSDATICSNVNPTVGGVVTATGAWTLTLSNGQTTSGTGSGPWSIVVNTINASNLIAPLNSIVTLSVSALIDANNCPAAIVDRPGAVTFTKRTITAGSIHGASNVKVCEGQAASINVVLTSGANCPTTSTPRFSGVFAIEYYDGIGYVPHPTNPTFAWTSNAGASTSGVNAAIAIPASILNNPNSYTLQYRISWVSLTDCAGCTADPLDGSVIVEIVPNPTVIVSAAPVGNVCPGTTVSFTVSQAPNSYVQPQFALFNWIATTPTGAVVAQGQNNNLGTISFATPACPFNDSITVRFTPLNSSCCNCLYAPIFRKFAVRDTTKPVWVTVPAALNVTLECSDVNGLNAANLLKPVASDNCDTDVTNIVKSTGLFVSNGAPCTQSGTYTNTWTVTDDCGNLSAIYTQVITITDTTKPLLVGTIPANISNINNCKSNAPTPPNVGVIAGLFTDNCGTVSASLVTTNTGTDCAWSFTHTYTVRDNCGNTVTAPVVIVYSGGDKTAPVLRPNTTFPNGATELNLCQSQAPVGPTAADIAALYVDNCGRPINVVKSGTFTNSSNDCNWDITYSYVITDSCGNQVLPVPTIRYQGFDATAPTLNVAGSFPVGQANINNCYANAPNGPTRAAIAALYSDNCGGAIIVDSTRTNTLTSNCGWSITYTYTVKDKCNNFVANVPTVTFSGRDLTAPVLITAGSFPTGQTNINSCYINAPNGPTKASIAALYSDNCGGAITVDSTRTNTLTSNCGWSITYTYTVRDACNNFVANVPTVTFSGRDLTAPTLITAGSFPVGQANINSCYSATAPAGPTRASIAALYSDNCGGLIIVDSTKVINSTDNCNWSITYNYTVRDTCNNFVANVPSVTYTGRDQTAPVFTNVIPTQYINTGAGANCSGTVPDYTGLAVVTDCGLFKKRQLAPYAPGTQVFGFNGSIFVTIEASDSCGNKSQQTFEVQLKDSTKPNAICKPATVYLNAAGTVSINVATVNNGSFDNCTPIANLITSISKSTFDCSNTGANQVKLYVTDICGNIDSCISTVTVLDTIKPVISCWGDTTINKDANCTYIMADLTFRVNKADACGPLVVTQSPAAGVILGASILNMPVTLTVKDPSGNTSTCTFNITFRDVTPPVISGCPSNITVFTGLGNANCSQTATWIPPTATDACIVCCLTQPITGNFAPGATFPVGVTTVTYTATDASNNTSTCNFTVTVIDNTKPILTGCPAPVAVTTGIGRTSCDQVATWTEPTATDNCTATANLVRFRSHAPGATFPVGVTTVKYAFTDVAGNTSDTCSFAVTVTDNTVPVFTSCPSNIANPPINVTGCLASVVTPNPVVTDNCGVVRLTWAVTGAGITPAATSPVTGINFLGTRTFNFGVSTVTYTATDAAGNSSTCSYTVNVTRPFAATIAGTSTVLQNDNTTSTVTFTATSGTAPYTFVYNVNGGTNITLVTNNLNSTPIAPNGLFTTVAQSNAIVGTYTYTLVSATDALGCSVSPNTTAVITIVGPNQPRPDLTSSIRRPLSSNFSPGQSQEGYIQVDNVQPNATTGISELRVFVPNNYTLSIGSGTTMSAGSAVSNPNLDITLAFSGTFYTVKTKPGVLVNGLANFRIGFVLTASGGVGTNGLMTVNVLNNTGGASIAIGDLNSSNNQTISIFTIN